MTDSTRMDQIMRVYIGFDDTDHLDADRGTGKLARWFQRDLPEGCQMWGVVRQQLLVDDQVPYTSHNSSACVVVDVQDASLLAELKLRAMQHIERYALAGSDPGLCIAYGERSHLTELSGFGRKCTSQLVTQKEALKAASAFHLSGHGGTNDGIIGAAAAVGLTAHGWSGRFIEFGKLRGLPDQLRVADLGRLNILVVSLDRDAQVPAPDDLVVTKNWLRPRLWGQRPILPVLPIGNGAWESLGDKRRKQAASNRLSLVSA